MRSLLLVASLVAPAEFAVLDRNADGYLTRLEVLAEPEIAKRFASFDIDRDARLSPGEFAAARVHNQRRAQNDAALMERVKAALTAESRLPSKAISVEAYEGRVELSGFVPFPDMASRAGRVVAGVSGVRTVHNNITVK